MSRMAEQQLYIHGGYTSATSGRTFETINPANGNVLATVQAAGREDVDRAVKSAQQGQKIWAAMTAMERAFCVGPLIFCVNAMTNSQNWKPSIPEKHIRKPQPSISLPVRTCWSTMPG
jgi:hypothetical protein